MCTADTDDTATIIEKIGGPNNWLSKAMSHYKKLNTTNPTATALAAIAATLSNYVIGAVNNTGRTSTAIKSLITGGNISKKLDLAYNNLTNNKYMRQALERAIDYGENFIRHHNISTDGAFKDRSSTAMSFITAAAKQCFTKEHNQEPGQSTTAQDSDFIRVHMRNEEGVSCHKIIKLITVALGSDQITQVHNLSPETHYQRQELAIYGLNTLYLNGFTANYFRKKEGTTMNLEMSAYTLTIGRADVLEGTTDQEKHNTILSACEDSKVKTYFTPTTILEANLLHPHNTYDSHQEKQGERDLMPTKSRDCSAATENCRTKEPTINRTTAKGENLKKSNTQLHNCSTPPPNNTTPTTKQQRPSTYRTQEVTQATPRKEHHTRKQNSAPESEEEEEGEIQDTQPTPPAQKQRHKENRRERQPIQSPTRYKHHTQARKRPASESEVEEVPNNPSKGGTCWFETTKEGCQRARCTWLHKFQRSRPTEGYNRGSEGQRAGPEDDTEFRNRGTWSSGRHRQKRQPDTFHDRNRT